MMMNDIEGLFSQTRLFVVGDSDRNQPAQANFHLINKMGSNSSMFPGSAGFTD